MAQDTPLALVGDDSRFARGLSAALERAGLAPAEHYTAEEIRARIDGQCDALLVLAAARAEDVKALRLLVQEIRLQRWPLRLVLVESEEVAREGALAGLAPHLVARLSWPEGADRLADLVRRHGRRGSLLPRELGAEERLRRQLLAQTPSLLALADRVALAARHDVPVLLTGETGTGKTFLARLIHDHSSRARQRFLTVSCGAIAANLVESEFFGHVRGAFTGADRDTPGKFAAANDGTLLLDEIDTLGLPQQAGLLRVVETGEFEPVGSAETKRSSARLLVASNWDLEAAVEAGRFRKDLYYRLNVLAFLLPPLRERVQDVAPLVRGMAARFTRKFNKDLFDVSPEAMAALESCPWPGNLRQLENAVQQAVLHSAGLVLLPSHLPHGIALTQPSPVNNGRGNGRGSVLSQSREAAERGMIERALASVNYSRTLAARQLGISRVMLYKKIKKYGLLAVRREAQ